MLKELTIFSIASNFIKSLPCTFMNLNSLNTLNISKNGLESFGSELTSLSNLQSLHIYNNFFKFIPTTIKNLKKLKEFSLEWFKYTSPPIMPVIKNDDESDNITKFF